MSFRYVLLSSLFHLNSFISVCLTKAISYNAVLLAFVTFCSFVGVATMKAFVPSLENFLLSQLLNRNRAAISIFRYRRVTDTIERKLMVFTHSLGYSVTLQCSVSDKINSTCHLSEKRESVFSKLK